MKKFTIKIWDQGCLWFVAEEFFACGYQIKDGYLRVYDDTSTRVFAAGQWHSFTVEETG